MDQQSGTSSASTAPSSAHPLGSGRFTRYASSIKPSGIRALEALAATSKDLIAFGPGRPDDAMFPFAAFRDAHAAVLGPTGAAAHGLQYAPSEGSLALRSWLAARERSAGRRCEVDNVLITSGSQQAIHLITKLLAEPGDSVVVQSPTYPGMLQVLEANGASIITLDDAELAGPDFRPAFIYAMADFQNPTGATLSMAERENLVALARRLDTFLVEDNAYEVLRLEGEALPSLLDIAGRSGDVDRTLYVGSFSKCAAPGMRLGWILGPSALIARLTLIKQTEDLQASTLSQDVMAHMADHIFGPHAEALRHAYKARRDRMLEALDSHITGKARWRRPSGGFFVWLTLDRAIDTTALLPRAIEAGVAYVPGQFFFHDQSGANHLRLSYSSVALDRMEEGVERLGRIRPAPHKLEQAQPAVSKDISMRKRLLAFALFAGVGAAQAATVTPILSHDLDGGVGKEGAMMTVELAPGEAGGVHRHNANVFVYVLSGAMVMQVKGGALVTVHAGQTFYEGPGDIHVVSRNASTTEPAKFIAFFVKDKGAPIVVPVH